MAASFILRKKEQMVGEDPAPLVTFTASEAGSVHAEEDVQTTSRHFQPQASEEDVVRQPSQSSSRCSSVGVKRPSVMTIARAEFDYARKMPKQSLGKGKKTVKERDMSWLLSGMTSGGPHKTDVIPSFGGHIAYSLWNNSMANDGRILVPYTRDRCLQDLEGWSFKDNLAMDLVKASGLSHLQRSMLRHLDLPLISAFVERWQPDTNTFHMPFGEMTILLHDVSYILGISVDGEACSASPTSKELQWDVAELLGIELSELGKPWIKERGSTQIYRSGAVLVTALRHITHNQTHGLLATQGYLMYLLGSTLFVDKSCDRIRSVVSCLLKDVHKVSTYAWGTGTLAYLYRQLGIASRIDAKGICGCLTLLQGWIYEYFPCFRPSSDYALDLGTEMPRVRMWGTGRSGSKNDVGQLKTYRAMLDQLTADQITWLPYGSNPGADVPRSLFSGCIRFIDVIEPYQPDRCLRQFGYTQVIPSSLLPPEDAYRSARPAMYEVTFPSWSDVLWKNWLCHCVIPSSISTPAKPSHAHAEGYMEWWNAVSHPHVINPNTQAAHKVRQLRPVITTCDRSMLAIHIVERLAPALLIPQDQRPPGMEDFWKLVDELTPLLTSFMGED